MKPLKHRDEKSLTWMLLDEAATREPDYPDVHALLSDWHTLALTQGWLADRDAAVRTVEAEARQLSCCAQRPMRPSPDSLAWWPERARRRLMRPVQPQLPWPLPPWRQDASLRWASRAVRAEQTCPALLH